MKPFLTLILALLLVLLVTTQLPDYLGQHSDNAVVNDKDNIDYYLTDFTLKSVKDDGSVSYTLSGQHLSHWQQQKVSFIDAPFILGEGSAEQRLQARADGAELDQTPQQAILSGKVHIIKPGKNPAEGLNLYTDHLTYNLDKHELSTDDKVLITDPSGTTQSIGLLGKLDLNTLRLNSNVHSSYKAK